MMTFFIRLVLGASAFIGHAAATGDVSEYFKSLPLVMNPNGVACHDEFHITSARLCVVAAKRMRITKMKIHIDSKFQPPYGCSLKGKTIYFNGDKNAKPPKKSVSPICRILPECYMCDPDPSMNPSKRLSAEPSVEPTMGLSTQPSVNPSMKSSMHPSEKVSFNPSVELSMNPSKRVSVEPSVEPTMGLSTQPSVNPSTKSSMHPSEKVSFNPSVELSMNPSKRVTVEPTVSTVEPTVSDTVDPSSTFTFNGSQVISKAQDYDDYAGLIAKPSTDYILRFTIEPYGLTLKEWSNIIHIGEYRGVNIDYGAPAVYFQPDSTKIGVVVGSNGEYTVLSSYKQLAIKTEYKIEIRVVGKYCKLSINGVADSTMTIGDRSLLSNVRVYFGDPWNFAANAAISNVYFGPA